MLEFEIRMLEFEIRMLKFESNFFQPIRLQKSTTQGRRLIQRFHVLDLGELKVNVALRCRYCAISYSRKIS